LAIRTHNNNYIITIIMRQFTRKIKLWRNKMLEVLCVVVMTNETIEIFLFVNKSV
jgi:hypothetical protein